MRCGVWVVELRDQRVLMNVEKFTRNEIVTCMSNKSGSVGRELKNGSNIQWNEPPERLGVGSVPIHDVDSFG